MRAAAVENQTAATHLPSHISAFGDDLNSNLQAVCAGLDASGEDAAIAITSEYDWTCGGPVALL